MDERRKIVLGQLIDFYREELEEMYGANVWGVDQFIYNTCRENSESICSRTTYYRLKMGTPIKTQTYYDLIAKLGYQYKHFDIVEEYIPDLMKELYQAVFYLDRDMLHDIQVRVDRLFKEAKEYFYYRDIYKVLCFIIELHSDELHSFDELDVMHIEKVSEIVNVFNINLLYYSYLIYEVNHSKNLKKLDSLFNRLPNFDSCDDPLVLFCILYKHNNRLEIELLNQTINKLKPLIPRDNYNFFMRVRLRELAYIYNFNSSMAEASYQETYRYLLERPFVATDVQKGIHYNYAMFLFLNNRYIEACEIFERYFSVNESFDIYAEVFYVMCHMIENKTFTREYDLKHLNYSNLFACILKYCVKKQRKVDNNILLDIMIQEIIPKCYKGLPAYIIDFLRNEVIWIASQCKRYKLIADFEECLKKANKN